MIEHKLWFTGRMQGKSTLMVREAMGAAKARPGHSSKIITPDGIFFVRFARRQK